MVDIFSLSTWITMTIISVILLIVFAVLRFSENMSDFWALTIGGTGTILSILFLIFNILGLTGKIQQPIDQRRLENCPLQGTHALRKLSNKSMMSGYFVLGTGSIEEQMQTHFAWDTGLGYYKVSKIATTQMQWVITDTEIPYIKFHITDNCRDYIDAYDRITVYLKEEDFPHDIDTSL